MQLMMSSTNFGLLLRLVRRTQNTAGLEQLKQLVKEKLSGMWASGRRKLHAKRVASRRCVCSVLFAPGVAAGELKEFQADLLAMAIDAQLHPQQFMPLDEGTVSQVISDCTKSMLAAEKNRFMPTVDVRATVARSQYVCVRLFRALRTLFTVVAVDAAILRTRWSSPALSPVIVSSSESVGNRSGSATPIDSPFIVLETNDAAVEAEVSARSRVCWTCKLFDCIRSLCPPSLSNNDVLFLT